VDTDRIEGKVKELEGKVTDDETREAAGRAQGTWGELKDKADDAWEDAKDKGEDLVDRIDGDDEKDDVKEFSTP
jgi:uncharacterized protein YjbJ (UPF0337 family)